MPRLRIPRSRSPIPKPNPMPNRRNESGSVQIRELPSRPTAKPAAAPFVDVATELDDDRKPSIHTGGNVFIKGATILTVTKGTIAKGSILVKDGKIKAVGTGLTAPAGREGHRRRRAGGDARNHRHPLAHRRPGGRQRGDACRSCPRCGSRTWSPATRSRSTAPWPAERRRPACSTARPTRSAARMPWSSCATASRAAT